jgi:CHAT domain-containing protein
MESLKLIIDGIKQTNCANEKDNSLLEIKHSFMMNGSVRGISERHEIDIKDDEIVEFIFEDDTTWLCDNFTIAELFPEQMAATNRSADGGLGGFVVPLNLPQNDSNQRNLLDTIALKVLNIFVNKAIEKEVSELAIDFENKQLENNKGLFKLDKNFELQTYNPKDDSLPYFLFIHGTFSSTEGSFGDLKNSEIWKFIQQNYGERVLAFQHETLSKSPLQNVVDLIEKFPNNIVLHIISHSRGGLIGDILSTYAHRSTDEGGFTKAHIELLKKEKNRQDDLDAIVIIDKIFKEKNIQVKKFIRVACPAGGTILASNRMGNFFNVSANLLGLALGSFSNPIFVALKNLLSAIINSKDNVEVLPGLEAQNPDSVFIKILNDTRDGIGINDNLIVISSNAETSFTLKGLVVITSKIFFSQRNDLVVNTDSMYMGVKRLGNIQYYFDEEAKIDHISYFKTDNTLSKLLIALKTPAGEIIPEFKIVAQNEVPSTDRNLIHDILGLENGELSSGKVLGKKPIVILLPGIMGSSLKRNNNDLIWIDYLDFAAGNLELLDINAKNITAPSIIKSSYQKLYDKLSDSYDVVTFSFDWRLSLNSSAEKLSEKITELLKYQQPIKIVAHSMGGVLFRDFIINFPSVWDKLKNTINFKALFLGTPFGGAFRIPAVLMGDDAIIKSLTKIDIFHTKLDLLNIFSQFPGVLCLLPLTTEGKHDFSKMEVWNELKSASNQPDLTLPSKSDLLEFGKYRDKILKERDHIDYSDMVYIAGKADATPYDYQVNKFSNSKKNQELVFLGTSEGDQSVTWESGIPKQMIDKNAVYYVNVTHGALANEPDLFQGIEEILIKGSTNIFSKSRPQLRGGNVISPMPAIINFDLSKAGIEATIMGTGLKNPPLSNQVTINVKVSNGDLMYSQFPLLAAHFKNDGILNAEKAIDGYLNKILTMRHQLNLYPSEIGTSEIFVSHNEYNHSAFKGAIIVGLGKFGELTRTLLAQTIEQGVCNYLLKLMLEKDINSTPEVGISALLVGCSYGGLSVENSVLSVVEGVRNANEKMKSMYKNEAMSINEIEFVERYEDRALSCYYALAKMANSDDRSIKIVLSNNTIKRLLGSKRRIVLDNVEEWWNRITVIKKHSDNEDDIPELTFSASSKGAREDEKPLFTNTPVLDQMISKISVQNNWTEDLAKTIFELLIPNDFKEQLKKKSSIAWILDKDTAAYPWELLQDTENNSKPFCINAGMVRQLRTGDSRQTVNLVTENKALVIGDPDLEGFVNQLPGALKEGETVAELLVNNNFTQTTKLLNKSAYEVIKGLFADQYKIIHLAGHGVFNEKNPKKSGMVIGKDLFLTTFEIAQMSTVPEFVFVNCCFLGSISGAAEEYYQNRYKLAASIGTQLIENGVKAVIVAGWAVNDDSALKFAKEFYGNMFEGHNFGESVMRARNKIYSKTENTWGAYQCYGDQFYKFSYNSPNQKFTPNYVIAEEAEIALSNLENALETGNFPYGNPIDSLTIISRAVDIAGLRTPTITEAEARIYSELGEYSMAFKKYKSLLKEEKASFSVKSVEKYCNIWTKMSVLDCLIITSREDSLKDIDKAIALLNGLLDLERTSERFNLLGSAYKRKAYLIDSADVQGKTDAYTISQENYKLAYEKNPNTYSLTNWITFNYILTDRNKLSEEDKHLKKAKEHLKNSFNEMDFWNLAYDSNIKLCELIIAIHLTKKKISKNESPEKEIIDSYKKLWKMAGTKGKKIGEIEHLQIIEDVAKLKGMQDVSDMVRSIIEQFQNII